VGAWSAVRGAARVSKDDGYTTMGNGGPAAQRAQVRRGEVARVLPPVQRREADRHDRGVVPGVSDDRALAAVTPKVELGPDPSAGLSLEQLAAIGYGAANE
jgi:hypothetical protein